jgi:hypothetical protein
MDIGGQNINLVMKFLTAIDLTNGAVDAYKVEFGSKAFMVDGEYLEAITLKVKIIYLL